MKIGIINRIGPLTDVYADEETKEAVAKANIPHNTPVFVVDPKVSEKWHIVSEGDGPDLYKLVPSTEVANSPQEFMGKINEQTDTILGQANRIAELESSQQFLQSRGDDLVKQVVRHEERVAELEIKLGKSEGHAEYLTDQLRQVAARRDELLTKCDSVGASYDALSNAHMVTLGELLAARTALEDLQRKSVELTVKGYVHPRQSLQQVIQSRDAWMDKAGKYREQRNEAREECAALQVTNVEQRRVIEEFRTTVAHLLERGGISPNIARKLRADVDGQAMFRIPESYTVPADRRVYRDVVTGVSITEYNDDERNTRGLSIVAIVVSVIAVVVSVLKALGA